MSVLVLSAVTKEVLSVCSFCFVFRGFLVRSLENLIWSDWSCRWALPQTDRPEGVLELVSLSFLWRHGVSVVWVVLLMLPAWLCTWKCWSVQHCGSDWNVSTTVEWIVMKSGPDSYVFLRMVFLSKVHQQVSAPTGPAESRTIKYVFMYLKMNNIG